MPYHPIEQQSGYVGKFGLISDRGGQIAEVDPLGYLVVIDVIHHKIHEGEYFVMCDVDVTLSASPKYWIMINNTPNAIHGVAEIVSSVAGLFSININPLVGTFGRGSLGTFNNHNRTSTGTTALQFYATPQGLNGTGSSLLSQRLGQDGKAGGNTTFRDEILYKPFGTYLFKFEPDAVGGKISLCFGMYEHEVV